MFLKNWAICSLFFPLFTFFQHSFITVDNKKSITGFEPQISGFESNCLPTAPQPLPKMEMFLSGLTVWHFGGSPGLPSSGCRGRLTNRAS